MYKRRKYKVKCIKLKEEGEKLRELKSERYPASIECILHITLVGLILI